MNKYIIVLNQIIVTLIILFNVIWFFPASYEILKEKGGPMGFGLLILPMLFVLHMFLIPAIVSILSKNKTIYLFIVNIIAIILSILYKITFS